MLSKAKLESYRAMTIEEQWFEVEQLMTLAWRMLSALPAEQVETRLASDRAEHDRADARILNHLRRFP
jgi:hypothetical protein